MQNVMPGGISIKETSGVTSPEQPRKAAAAKPKSKGGGLSTGARTPNSARRKVIESKTEINSGGSENCISESVNHITRANKPPIKKVEVSPTKSSPASPVKTSTVRNRPAGLTTSPSSPTKNFVRQTGPTLSPLSSRSTISSQNRTTNTGIRGTPSPTNRSPIHNRSAPTVASTTSPINSSPVSPQHSSSRYVPPNLRVKKREPAQSSVSPTKQTVRSPISESKTRVQNSRKLPTTKATTLSVTKKTEKPSNRKVAPPQEVEIKKEPETWDTTDPEESVKSSSLEPSDNQSEAQAKKAEKKRRQKQKKKEKEKANKSLKTEGADTTDSSSLKTESNNDKLGIFISTTSPENPPEECNETLTVTTSIPVEPQPNLESNPKTDINSVEEVPHETNLEESDAPSTSETKPESDSINELEKTVDSNIVTMADESTGQNRDAVKAAREAKKLAKQAAKKKVPVSEQKSSEDPKVVSDEKPTTEAVRTPEKNEILLPENQDNAQKTREQIKAEREAKKQAKQAKRKGKAEGESTGEPKTSTEKVESLKQSEIDSAAKQSKPKPEKQESGVSEDKKVDDLCTKMDNVHISGNAEGKKKQLTKAERRALQEAQREAKAKALGEKQPPQSQQKEQPAKTERRQSKGHGARKRTPSRRRERAKSAGEKPTGDYKVKLFNHLHDKGTQQNRFLNHSILHPAIVKLGEQYAKRTIVGSNARCIAFLYALKSVVKDFETPPKQDFRRSLEQALAKSVSYLQDCRPLAVSISNAYKHMKYVFTQLEADLLESDLKEQLCESIDTYIRDQIEKAAEAISNSVQEKISNGDVILTFGCSSLINRIFTEAHRRGVDFRVILVDSRPFLEGHELLRRLVSKGIKCTCVLINAVGFIMPEATKVLLGAHALLANGYVMARTGTAQVALVANEFNVPVLVCCETHKFSERVQTDAIVYNELGNPDDLIEDLHTKEKTIENWRALKKFSPVNLNYDVTPPELVTAVVTEVAILPCTSVPVILRIKPSESG